MLFKFQLILIEEAWCELFIIACAQWKLLPSDWLDQVVQGDGDLSKEVMQTLGAFKSTIKTIEDLKVDDKEMSCLKFIVLFNSSKWYFPTRIF